VFLILFVMKHLRIGKKQNLQLLEDVDRDEISDHVLYNSTWSSGIDLDGCLLHIIATFKVVLEKGVSTK
jgi:hypothetical protein